MWDGVFAAFARRDAGGYPFIFKSFTIPIRIIASIGQQVFGRRQCLQQVSSADIIATLACAQKHAQGAARRVGDRVKL
jgi:hypothetical protein